MSAAANSRLVIKKRSIQSLFRDVHMGRFAIPRLQREFVWDGRKSAKLLDSIYLGMPIGIPLIWQAKKSERLFLRQRYHVLPPFDHRNREVWFLVDGQQRVSALHRVKEGGELTNARSRVIDFGRVVLSLDSEDGDERIRYRKPVPGRFIPLCDVLHPHWQHRVGPVTKRQRDEIRRCRERILHYKAHLMFVRMKIGQVRECFLRINTQGMKLTAADAIFTKAESLELRELAHEVREQLDPAFRDIGEIPILWAIAATRGGIEARGVAINQAIRRIQRRAEESVSFKKQLGRDWSRLVQCLGKAVDYLRGTFSVLNRDFLYSDYMLAMLALFFYWNQGGPSQHQSEEIRKWFWATAVGGRYSGRNFLRCIPEDVRFFRRLAEKRDARFRYSQQVEKADIRRTQYQGHTGIGAAFYCLLALRRPVSILDDGINPVPLDRHSTRANRKDRHHIFPRGPLRQANVPLADYNSICNVCLLTAEENQRIGSRRPASYLREPAAKRRQFARKMRSHLIPHDNGSGLWEPGLKRGFKRFIKGRTNLLCRAFEQEAGIRLFRRDA